jgi:hypothetical protein
VLVIAGLWIDSTTLNHMLAVAAATKLLRQ